MWTAEQFISVGFETDYRITLQQVLFVVKLFH